MKSFFTGIVLAGGKGTRLRPFTYNINKHLLPVYDVPLIYFPLITLKNSGIMDVVIIVGKESKHQYEIIENSGFYNQFGFKSINYCYQDNPTGGMADAINKAKKLKLTNNIVVIPGDNIFSQDFKINTSSFKGGAVAHIKRVEDPSRFGVASFKNNDPNSEILDLIEKPKEFISNWAVIAPYIFDNTVFEKIKTLKPSARGELEITDLLRIYNNSKQLKLHQFNGKFIDAGTIESLWEAGYMRKNQLI